MGGAHCRAISYAVQTWSSIKEQNDINDWTCWVNVAPWTSPLSFLMGLRSFSYNSSGGSGMICLLVSMMPCLIRKSAISWTACSITCTITYLHVVHWGFMQIMDLVPTAAHAHATWLQLFLVILNKARRSCVLIHKLREVACINITHTWNVTVCSTTYNANVVASEVWVPFSSLYGL